MQNCSFKHFSWCLLENACKMISISASFCCWYLLIVFSRLSYEILSSYLQFGARHQDHKIKSCVLYQLSQPGPPLLNPFFKAFKNYFCWCMAWRLGRRVCSASCWALLISPYQKGVLTHIALLQIVRWKFSHPLYHQQLPGESRAVTHASLLLLTGYIYSVP